jgi:NAD(P)-dependent dehydrogenase (short-subunit alcohol dehydrogenase family)
VTDVTGRTVLVFGARHLGRTIARGLSAEGWSAAAVARTEDTIASLRADLPDALGLVADATVADDVERAFAETRERFGGIDLVVNAVTARPRGAFGGGGIAGVSPDALEPYVDELLPAIFNVVRIGARVLAEQGRGTLVQITGGSARRGMPGRGPWAAGAFATRGLVQAAAAELREQGVHVALLIVDATIASAKTAERIEGQSEEATATEEDVLEAVRYLEAQSPRAWTHELQITPRLDRWVP